MDSHFRDNINLPKSHPYVLGHCYLFLVKNRVFGLLDWIAPKLPQKIRKNSRSMTGLDPFFKVFSIFYLVLLLF
ncbi:hypothetical protein MTR_8g024580 [Medicago truncatula]|uniref:Uncharacterized protein n=1 Tax=Medicago truncatula TaxID=3880 RepID=A0A072TMY8_MEDTR|nr:hypothetical protein MTR_8g024580 [Medicago truncatula]